MSKETDIMGRPAGCGSSPARAKRSRARLRALALIVSVGLLSAGAIPADRRADEVDTTRAALEKWVETKRLISKNERDLALAREMLHSRIDLVQNEIDSLREKTAEAEESISEADKKKGEMVEENEKLKETTAALVEMVSALESRTRDLLDRLPQPIRERVRPLSQQFPDDPKDTPLSLSQRFQNVIGVLNEVNNFNREVTVTSEVRKLPDGTSAQVTAMYVGIDQGYYVGANDTIAGVGRAEGGRWTWTPANDIAPQVAEAIAVLKNERVASFVRLPVEVR